MNRIALIALALLSAFVPRIAGAIEVSSLDLDAKLAVVNLPGKARTMKAGGGGRFLIFHLPEEKKLAIVDVVKTSVVKEIEVPEDVVYAASQRKLIIVFPGQKFLQRWDLKKLEREQTLTFKATVPITKAVMGYAGDGPLLLWSGGAPRLWDIEKMKPINVVGPMLSGSTRYGFEVRVSADGQTFCGWTSGISGQQFVVMQLFGNRTGIIKSPDGHSFNERWAQPHTGGDYVFRYSGGIYSRDMKVVSPGDVKGAVLVPTVDPRFFLAVRPENGNKTSSIAICTMADRKPILTITKMEPISMSSLSTRWGYLRGQPRAYYLPKEKLLVNVPVSNDRIAVRRLNLEKTLAASEEDYLYVVSAPPTMVALGSTYNYKLDSYSKSKDVRYKLESGPQGMTLTKEGKLTWKVTKRPADGRASVVVLASNATGKETLHSFEIMVLPSRAKKFTQTNPRPDGGDTKGGGKTETPDPTEVSRPAGPFRIAPGLARRWLIIKGDQLAVIAPDGITVEKTIKLPKSYHAIGERRDYYVAVCSDPKSIDVIDKKTLKVTKSQALSFLKPHDLVLHPRLPISYFAFNHDIKLPRFKFIVFNEKTGQGREGEDLIGQWLAVGPTGRWMVSGYMDIYQRGSRLIMNPKRWHVTPDYGNIDWLIRYDIGRDGMPRVAEVLDKAGGNGKGIRLSPDGRRVTYLSHVGSPMFSKNLSGWDPVDLKKLPAIYGTKDRATTYELAYHPVLPLVASPGSGSAVFFHRETGEREENRLKLEDDALEGAVVHRIYFSPNGKNLIFDVAAGSNHYLHKAELKLTAAERKKIDAYLKSSPVASPLDPDAKPPRRGRIALTELDSLKGGLGKKMSSKEIARFFMDSVVVIRSEEGSGTGFVVGRNGYIVTCAHCLSGDGDVRVSYRGENAAPVKAAIVSVDPARDLALLKIDVDRALQSVRLAVGRKIEAGEPVSVIGNPGVGGKILDHTITEGIVSSPQRVIGEVKYLQTSASVNPGSSGGPVFNDRGLVIGMVELKARIEGAGFALMADDIATFLMQSIKQDAASLALTRQWYDSAEKNRLDASFLRLSDDQVLLKRSSDGREFSLPLSRLSEADRTFLRLLNEK